jgi:hypothetical protein
MHRHQKPHVTRPIAYSSLTPAYLSRERIKRRVVLGGLINEYERAA